MTFFELAPCFVLAFAACAFPLLFFVTAPYGRHVRNGWGPMVNARLGWVFMESPSVFLFAFIWWRNPDFGQPMVLALGGLWLLHYVQRTFVFSMLMKGQGKQQPFLTAGLAFCFNLFNAPGNASALRQRPFDAAFFIGAGLFVVGFAVNVQSDSILRGLRGPGEDGYKIPKGGLYGLITSPNYFGEIVEWVGFAIAAQTLAAWAFAVFTFANLAPRAVSHHRWYRKTFADYPLSRRALIPFVWCAVFLMLGCASTQCVLPASTQQVAVENPAPSEENRVYELDDSPVCWATAAPDAAQRQYLKQVTDALGRAPDQHAMLLTESELLREGSPKDAQNAQALYDGRVGTIAPISGLERALWRAQDQRFPMLSHATEFGAFVLRRPGRVRVYFSSLDRNGQKVRSEVMQRVRDDVKAGWVLEAHLHNHPFMFNRQVGDRLFTTELTKADSGGRVAPSSNDVHFYLNLADAELRAAWVTNGLDTSHIEASSFSSLSAADR